MRMVVTMTCKECLHDGVCFMQEVCEDLEEQLAEFGCNDYKTKAEWVPVVRCKDCKYYFRKYCTVESMLDYTDIERAPNDFCSYGERKDGEPDG